MKTTTLRAKLLSCFFAFTLVFGLCIPTLGINAYADPQTQRENTSLSTENQDTTSTGEQTPQLNNEQNANQADQAGEGDRADQTGLATETQTTQAEQLAVEEVQLDVSQQDAATVTLPTGAITNTNQQFGLTITGGTPGVDYYFISETCTRPARTGTAKLQDTLNKLVIIGSSELTLSNDNVAAATNATIWVAPGTQARVVFNNVNINAPVPCHIERNRDASGATIEPITSLHITLAKNSDNTLTATAGRQAPAIHCGEGTKLTIDDDVPNVTTAGNPIAMNPTKYPGKIPAGTSFVGYDGVERTAGTTAGDDRLSLLENPNPGTVGKLKAYGALRVSAIGSVEYENTGEMIFDGGNIYADAAGRTDGTNGFGAAIGGGGAGSGGTLVFNGGTVETYTSYHAASIGGGAWAYLAPASAYQFEDTFDNGLVKTDQGSPHTVAPASATSKGSKTCAGNIFVNGGIIIPHAAAHGNAIGKGCCSYNRDHVIVIAGGTVLPDTSAAEVPNGDPKTQCVSMAIGAAEGAVSVVGGSVRIGNVIRPTHPQGKEEKYEATINGADSYSTAYGIYPIDPSSNANPTVEMIAIDLSSEVIKVDDKGNKLTDGNNRIIDWELTINGAHQEYGSPAQLTDGKLYLWLPASAKDKLVSVELSYLDDKGEVQKIEPLFRNPNEGSLLKRYIDFKLSDTPQGAEYESTKLTKDYDGLPFEPYDLAAYPITTDEAIPKQLTDPTAMNYRYQLYTERGDNGQPIGEEVSTGASMPSNEGIMKLTMVSTEFSNVEGFRDNYWGHRATTWCEIKSVPSQITNLKATWSNQDNGDVFHPSEDSISVDAIIKGGYFDDEQTQPTAPTCKAPEGQVQLYVDDKPVGDPVDIIFPDTTTNPGTRAITTQADTGAGIGGGDAAGSAGATAKTPNAERVDNGQGGSYTHFTYTFTPSQTDHLVPNATEDGKHKVSLRYLPSINYQMSANPENKDEKAPEVEVAIKPVDPKPTVEQGPKTPSPTPDDPAWPNPEVNTNADPEPVDPDNPDNPGGNPSDPDDINAGETYRGTITTSYKPFAEGETNPGRVILNIKTPSSGAVTVTDEAGNIIDATARVLCDDAGNPILDADGKKTVQVTVDPEAVGKDTLTITQAANGAFTPTTFIYAVTVKPDPTIAPEPHIAKTAVNLTHAAGPHQAGDKIAYTITASNTKKGSGWNDVVVTDPLPASLELDTSTLHMVNEKDSFNGDVVRAADSANLGVGEYALDTNSQGQTVLRVGVGTVYGESHADITFIATVKANLTGRDKAPASVANTAEATGTRPDPANPTVLPPLATDPVKTDAVVPVVPDPNDPTKPGTPDNPDNPGGQPGTPVKPGTPGAPTYEYVMPDDPDTAKVVTTKAVENLDTPDSPIAHTGDKLRYTITLANEADPSTCVYHAYISDPLPVGIEPDLAHATIVDAQGNTVAVNAAAWNKDARVLSVAVGDVWGQERATLTFEATITRDAVMSDVTNIAYSHGDLPSTLNGGPGVDPTDPTKPASPTTPGDPAPTDDPKGTPFVPSDGVVPGFVAPDDPAPGSVKVVKTATNTSRDDGTTHVNDVIRYTITLTNTEAGTAWMNAFVSDHVPAGLEPICDSIKLTRTSADAAADNAATTELAVADAAYTPDTRTLAVNVGHLAGGQTVTVTFDALVMEEARAADIGNVAYGSGTLPSDYDFEKLIEELAPGDDANGTLDELGYASTDPKPGTPAVIPAQYHDDWVAYRADLASVVSDAAYPPGVTAAGGVLAADSEATGSLIAKTSDFMGFVAAGVGVIALVAVIVLIVARKRMKK